MYLIYKLIWYLFAAILDRTVTLNTRIGKYVSYKLDEIISAPGVHGIIIIVIIHEAYGARRL